MNLKNIINGSVESSPTEEKLLIDKAASAAIDSEDQQIEKTTKKFNLAKITVGVLLGLLTLGTGVVGKFQDFLTNKVSGEVTKTQIIEDLQNLKTQSENQSKRLIGIEEKLIALTTRSETAQQDALNTHSRILAIETQLGVNIQESAGIKSALTQMRETNSTQTSLLGAVVSAIAKPPQAPIALPSPAPASTPKPKNFLQKVFGSNEKER